jgi:hypothetical protein
LIEHPPVVLLLDLILLKPRVFLHLLYNRGTKPLDATKSDLRYDAERTDREREREKVLWLDLKCFGAVTYLAEVVVRVLPHVLDQGVDMDVKRIIWVGVGVMVELLVQHSVTLAMGILLLRRRNWGGGNGKAIVTDGRKQDFL